MTVLHPEYGPGKIVALAGSGKNRRATIQFATVARKRSSWSIALSGRRGEQFGLPTPNAFTRPLDALVSDRHGGVRICRRDGQSLLCQKFQVLLHAPAGFVQAILYGVTKPVKPSSSGEKKAEEIGISP